MSNDPWSDPDPQAGDFDALLSTIDSRYVEAHEGNPDARLRILVSVEGADAERLERIAGARGKKPGEVVAELLREADRSAAQPRVGSTSPGSTRGPRACRSRSSAAIPAERIPWIHAASLDSGRLAATPDHRS
jgi:hypothetical protein